MDPNATLDAMREASAEILSDPDCMDLDAMHDNAVKLAEAVAAMDHWLSRAGHLPTEWVQG